MRNVLLSLSCLLSFTALSAGLPADSLMHRAASNFRQQLHLLPQEKLHVHTDKSCYINGEQIFFRIYLVDAMHHIPVHASRYVYAELVNPSLEAAVRVKIRPLDEAYSGSIQLPPDMPEGAYMLRCYTRFMQNLNEEYFFSKTIYIADPNSPKMEIEPVFNFVQGSKVYLDLKLNDLNSDPLPFPEEITLSLNGSSPQKVKLTNGHYKFRFNLSPDAAQRVLLLETTYRGYPYKKFIDIPYPDEDLFHVSFFPEGGQLVGGTNCIVAFKALNATGLAENISGEVHDSSGSVISTFQSEHAGMGLFHLNPATGETYTAVCTNESGSVFRSVLPEVKQNTYALKANQVRDKLYLTLNGPQSPSADELYLFVHCRGEILYARPWNRAEKTIVFTKEEFKTGVHHFLLLGEDLNPLSERLIFINNPGSRAAVTFRPEAAAYTPRKNVVCRLKLSDGGEPLTGSFSVSVTDDNEVQADSTANILTNLLLTSELRGNIENPAGYFDTADKKAGFKLDILMMTQGWRRYDVPKAIAGSFTEPQYEIEVSQEISGKVKSNILGTPIEKAQVSVTSAGGQYTNITETNADGKFKFSLFEFPDSTSYLVQALSKKGSARMVLTLDTAAYPPVNYRKYPRQAASKELLLRYIRKEEQKYMYEKGMRMIDLDEIEVTAKRKEESRSAYTSFADHSLTSDDIGQAGGLTVKKLLDRMGGVSVDGGGAISIRGKSPVLLLVNDIETDPVFLDDIEPADVLRIDVLFSNQMFGQRSENGIISISTKWFGSAAAKKQFNLKNTVPLGYHVPAEFYSPKYDTAEKKQSTTPDLRTTIYWNPNVKTDGEGNAAFDFYTADNASVYTISIEGISSGGSIIHYRGKIYNRQP